MSTFYYYKNAELHLCNRLLACTEENFLKLKNKGKITEERLQLIALVQKYRALTERMIQVLTRRKIEELQTDFTSLVDYGLLIKQFYECRMEEDTTRTETFYCASPGLPEELVEPDKKNDFLWKKDLRISDAMSILSFNQFHIALTENVPKKFLQAQMCYSVKKIVVDGRYRLKGKKFYLGYSHVFAVSVRDFAEHNAKIKDLILHISESYAYGSEKMPWIILICENKVQCANLNRKIKSDPDAREMTVYYILDTDIEFNENPLHVLQTFRFANEDKEIVSETFKVEDWFEQNAGHR